MSPKTKALKKMNYEALFVYIDICGESIVHGHRLLRPLGKNKKSSWEYLIDTPFYIQINNKDFKDFEVNIKLRDNTYPSHFSSPQHMTLHFK